jgi:hypothetical protein
MRYDTSLPGKMLDHYKDLKQFPALHWEHGVDCDKALRYCINLIDEESPIYSVTDVENRVKMAAQLAGFAVQRKNKSFGEPVENMMLGLDDKVNEMMFTIMGIYNSILFELWYSSKLSMHYLMKSLRTPPKDLNSKQLTEEAKTRVQIEQQLNSMVSEQLTREAKIFRSEELKERVSKIIMGRMVNYAEKYAEDNA